MSDSSILTVSPRWQEQHPGASVGLLAMRGVTNPASHDQLNAVAAELEAEIRGSYGEMERAELRASPPLPAYAAYYKRWGQRYHVAMQFESVAQKGKPVPRVAALVESMFIAELRNRLLTAGHDLDRWLCPCTSVLARAKRSPLPMARSRMSKRATCSSPTPMAMSFPPSSPVRPIRADRPRDDVSALLRLRPSRG